MLRERSCNTLYSVGHDSSWSGGASKSFAIHDEYRSSVVRFHVLCSGHRLPAVAVGSGGASARTVMLRVIVAQPDDESIARHVPAAGTATSAYQEYGGPSLRLLDVAATPPSGEISES